MARQSVLVETSAWVEYLRRTGSRVNLHLRRLIAEEDQEAIAITEPVYMELVAGERTAAGRDEVRSLLARFELRSVEGIDDWSAAAEIYRACRSRGRTLSSQINCLIAAVAIRTGTPLVHRNADFDFIAQHTPLEVVVPA